MNIFASSPCPVESAAYLDDKRVNKMITESMQMLALAMAYHGAKPDALPVSKSGKPYRTGSHVNHPCSIWVRATRSNYRWLLRHLFALRSEWIRRGYKGQHLFYNLLAVSEGAKYIPRGEETPIPNCASNSTIGVCFKHVSDVHQAYRLYLAQRWLLDTNRPKWSRNDVFREEAAIREGY